jgi:hypothetical protein
MVSVQDSGQSTETLKTKVGEFVWHDGPTAQALENTGSTNYEAIEIEWK